MTSFPDNSFPDGGSTRSEHRRPLTSGAADGGRPPAPPGGDAQSDRARAEPIEPEYHHQPVMCGEVVETLRAVPDGVMVDATVGGGGHALALLDAHPGLDLVGVDRDPAALDAARRKLARHRGRVTLSHARFDALDQVLDGLGRGSVSGCLFDLGVSSPQLDRPDRGFSYRHEGPLDMRMDPTAGPTAADVVNTADEPALAAMLARNADEPHARRIARAIVARRPFSTTTELAAAVAAAVPARARRRGHPARRAFQAIRIEVNGELDMLDAALARALGRLAPSGRCAVLSYHSGEDRIVKGRFRREAGEAPPPRPGLPPPPGARAAVRLLWRGARTPGPAEAAVNPRAASARLRAVERIPQAA